MRTKLEEKKLGLKDEIENHQNLDKRAKKQNKKLKEEGLN